MATIKEITISHNTLFKTYATTIVYQSGAKCTIKGYPEKIQNLVKGKTPKYVYPREFGTVKVYEI